ncbi:MAG: AEC family transporter [Promethearchaeota archaeon]
MDPNLVFILSLIIIAIGYMIKKLNLITEEEGKGIAKLIINITLPALVLDVITSLNLNPELFLLFFISFIYSLFVLSFGLIIFRNYPREIKGILLMTIIGFNIGLFAYPLIEGIWGLEGLQHIALFDFANAFVIFGICYVIAALFSPKNQGAENIKIDYRYIGRRLMTSVPLLSFILAVLLNLYGFQFTGFFSELIEVLSRANMALTLLILGIYLNFKFEKSEWMYVLKVLSIRYCFGLMVGIILFMILPFSLLYRTILLVALILPIGMAVVPFAIEFEYNEKLIGIIVNLSIIISFILMWIITLVVGV